MGTLVPSCRGWKRLTAAVCAGLMAGAFSFLPVAEARGGELLPQGGVSSTASIVTDSGTMNIAGAANNVIKWVSFSIGQDNAVKFDNNNYLNYVTGHARSEIMGTLTGGGNIYLVNPNGILIGDSARIDVGSLYLSTRNLTTDQLTDYATATGELFKAGNLNGDVINMGKLNADVITVEGNNITFKNVADVTKGGTLANGNITGGTLNNAVTLTANGGEIHLGYENGDAATAVNNDQYTTANAPTLNGWNFGGKTPAYYMLVRNKYELQNMQNNLSGNYMLAGDINASSISGFTPIGKDYDNAFTGRFDGLDYKLTGLKVTPINGFCGLFGQNNGTIENLEIGGITVVSDSYLEHYIGTVAGDNNGTIRNVRNTGGIDIDFAYNDLSIEIAYIGGIVARNYGTIQNAYNSGEISVDNAEEMGGIAGYNDGTIASVFNSGNLTGNCGSTNWMGGIAGFQYGTITDAYNSGAITNERGDGYTGGIVGANRGTVNRTYNLGNLTGGANLGGIAGGGWSWVSVENSYYLDNIAPVGEGSSKGTAKSADELRQAETFASWGSDISAVGSKNATWRIYEGNSNPLLTAFMTAKDNYKGTPVYNGEETGDVGANYRDSTYSGTAEQIGGINYVNDYTIVTPKELTVTGGVDKTYDGTTDATLTAANLEGVVTGDALTVDVTSAAYDNKNVGTGKTVTYGGLTISGAKAKNYTIGASGTTTGAITAKEISATFENISKTYDGTTTATAGAGTLAGVETIDNGKVSVTANAAYADKNAGTGKTVNYTGVVLSGEEAGNYTIAETATGQGTINQKEAQVTFNPTTKVYDGTTDATPGAATIFGLINADKGNVGVTADAAYEDKNVGTSKRVAYTNIALTGTEAQNYRLTQTSVDADNGIITRKALSLVADPVTITQGQEIPASFTGNLTGFVAGEGLAEGDGYAFALEGTPDAVGSYAVNGTLNGNASGDYGANYTFANAASNTTAFTINAKPAPSNPGGGSGGSVTPATPVNPVEPAPINPVEPAPINPAEPIPVNPAGPAPAIPSEPTPATPGTPGQAVTNPASGALRPEGTLAERVIAEAEAGNLSLGTVTELENAAETAKEQPFAKDMAAMAEMGAVEANAPAPAPSDSGHSYTMLDGGLVAVRDDVNSAPASAVMGSNPGRHNANEVMAAAAQADLIIGTEEAHNRQDNSVSDEDSDEKDKKQSE